MRGRVAVVTLFLVLGGALSASATSNESYKDKFDSIGWGGSNGSLPWSGPWHEVGDDNDEKFGAVRVVSSGNCASGNCINIDASLLANVGVKRSADTGIFEDAELCFDLHIVPGLELGGALRVQVNVGGGWVTIEEYDLGNEAEIHPEFDISGFTAESFQVRFLVTGVLNTGQVYIDNVEITGELLEEPTTTTTTAPTTTTTEGDDDGTTTTTKPRQATTTTRPNTISTVPEEATTTTVADTSTTTTIPSEEGSLPTLVVALGGGDGPSGPGGREQPPTGGGGIRQAGRGLQANFDSGLFGDVGDMSPITGVDLQARFSLAAEVIESTWVWMVLLAIVIAWSIVSGMERRRSQLPG